MSWNTTIYSPLSWASARNLINEFDLQLERYLESHPNLLENDEEAGLAQLMIPEYYGYSEEKGLFLKPTLSEPEARLRDLVIASNKSFGKQVPPNVLDRLSQCRSLIEIEKPEYPESKFQVAQYVFLLERCGSALFDS